MIKVFFFFFFFETSAWLFKKGHYKLEQRDDSKKGSVYHRGSWEEQ